MKLGKGFGFRHYGILVTVALSAVFGYDLFFGDRHLFLPGETTHGHHQIEMQCAACHVESFTADEPLQQACMNCHGDLLDKARDTHPKKKFTDPRNADLLANLDATQCVTCHVEHSPEITGQFGVTMPEDFCFYCHQDIADERPSHQEYRFDSCSDAGCHNYHDNRALYEKFLAKHLDQPDLLQEAKLRVPNAVELWLNKNQGLSALQSHDNDALPGLDSTPEIVEKWAVSAHAIAQVNCSDCHNSKEWALQGEVVSESNDQIETTHLNLELDSCSSCHQRQANSFQQGLHGMKLAAGLPPMQVADARLPMQQEAQHRSLNCATCHDPHKPDLQEAATQVCLGCHKDEHSLNYKNSAHAQSWEQELAGESPPGSGVSCASCHMPRIKKGKAVFVEHNQSLTLQPNSKMLRPVCLNCHGLEFSTAALADKDLINSNFSRPISGPHPGFELVRKRLQQQQQRKKLRAQEINTN